MKQKCLKCTENIGICGDYINSILYTKRQMVTRAIFEIIQTTNKGKRHEYRASSQCCRDRYPQTSSYGNSL